MILIKNVEIYSPKYQGRKDILIAGEKIEKIDDNISIPADLVEIIDGTAFKAVPGIIDRHVHVTGGGGEGGMTTRVPEIRIKDLIKNGITTVLGLLGTDGTTRTVQDLVAKTKSINENGLTAFALTGSYEYPTVTLMKDVKSDMSFVSEFIGAKVAVSDHRSSGLSRNELTRLASEVYVGGKLAGIKGILTIHMGDGKKGLLPVMECVEQSDLPISVFHPTHVNRNEALLEQSIEFMNAGGRIDLTCGSTGVRRPGVIVKELIQSEVDTHLMTFSSDGNGSYSKYDEEGNLLKIGAASLDALFNELIFMTHELEMTLEESLPYITSNVALALGLETSKGKIEEQFDADLLLLNSQMAIDTVIARGQVLQINNEIIKQIPFE